MFLFELESRNNPEMEKFLSDFDMFNFYKEKGKIDFVSVYKANLSPTLKTLIQGDILSKKENIIPLKETAKDANEYLIKSFIALDSFFERFSSSRIYENGLRHHSASYPLLLFKYYREFNNLSNKEQNKVIKILEDTLKTKKEKYLETKNSEDFDEYSYYSYYLFINYFFQHINGTNREKEINNLLGEYIKIFYSENSNFEDKTLREKLLSPLVFFYNLQGQKLDYVNEYNNLIAFSKDITEERMRILLSQIKFQKSDIFLDENKYIIR